MVSCNNLQLFPTRYDLGPPTSYYHDDKHRWWSFLTVVATTPLTVVLRRPIPLGKVAAIDSIVLTDTATVGLNPISNEA